MGWGLAAPNPEYFHSESRIEKAGGGAVCSIAGGRPGGRAGGRPAYPKLEGWWAWPIVVVAVLAWRAVLPIAIDDDTALYVPRTYNTIHACITRHLETAGFCSPFLIEAAPPSLFAPSCGIGRGTLVVLHETGLESDHRWPRCVDYKPCSIARRGHRPRVRISDFPTERKVT